MADELKGLPVFFEEFDPARKTHFDFELDEITRAYALERRVIKGLCNLTAEETEFIVSSDNLREDIVSSLSHSINRHRQVVCALSLALFGHTSASLAEIAAHVNDRRLKLYTAEAHSPLFQFLKKRLDPELLVSSEYFGPEHSSGEVVDGTLHEDLQQTSFEDEAFDIILTFEVFEHIPDALKAEREVVRILRKGGFYCFTVPFLPENEHDLVLADRDERGEDRFYVEPQYHGDPVRPDEGVLVYRLFSFHDLRQRFESLGCQFRTFRFWSKALGILDDNGWVHVVRKPFESESATGAEAIGEGDRQEEERRLDYLRAELAAARERLGEQAAALARTRAQLSVYETRLEQQGAQMTKLERDLAERESHLAALQAEHAVTEAELRRKADVLDWLQTSRSWRVANSLRRFNHELRRRLQLTGGEAFRGAVESPAEGARCASSLEVAGWVYSKAAPVTRVEAFLDDIYLGRLSYGVGREDVAAAGEREAPAGCGFRDSIKLDATLVGRRTLRVRVYDEQGHQRSYARPVFIVA